MRAPLHLIGANLSYAAVAATVGVVVTLTMTAEARNILGSGGNSSSTSSSSSSSVGTSPSSTNSNSAATAATAKRAKDALSKATNAVQALRASQLSAGSSSSSNVPNGLISGGLVVDTSKAWTGAKSPTQSAATDGKVTVTIVQNAQNAFLYWNSFNVGKDTTLVYDQSAGGNGIGKWIAFNKVNDPTGRPSEILGSIKAGGQVYIINHNGIIFGSSSQVNTHALVASAVPINNTLASQGLLENSNYEFLFDQAFDSTITSCGDVVVEKGATLVCPTTADNVGGKVILAGANVTNSGIISTPDGQTILAAGTQIGFSAHDQSDSTVRGLDVYIGTGAGTAENSATGLIYAPRASIIMAGKEVDQLGVIYSTTSVSLNGRIDLLASYNSISQVAGATGAPFLPQSTGLVTLGEGSVTAIVPEIDNTATDLLTRLKLTSIINIQGRSIYMGKDSIIYAPGASLPSSSTAYDFMGKALTAGVTLNAGEWFLQTNTSPYASTFENSVGQVYLDEGATISAAGLTDVLASVTQNLVTISVTSSELVDTPVQRDGVFAGASLVVDSRDSGTYNGTNWQGTSVVKASGYIDNIKRTVAQLSVNGGSIVIKAGESVVLQKGSVLDVSGGWISYTGGMVTTSRLISGGNIYDTWEATPDLVYDGIYSGFKETHSKWGVSRTYTSSILAGSHYEEGYIQGGNGGSVSVTSLAMALDGDMYGNTVTGFRQRSSAPNSSGLSLNFAAQKASPNGGYFTVSPAVAAAMDANSPKLSVEPQIVIGDRSTLAAADAFQLDPSGNAVALREDRRTSVFLAADTINENGFGNLTINNTDGSIVIGADTNLVGTPGGSLTFAAANITIDGRVQMAGGALGFTVYNYSPTLAGMVDQTSTPAADPTRGNFVLGASAVLDVSGLVVDDRTQGAADLAYKTSGGSISIKGLNVDLQDGSVIDVSAGVAISASSKTTYGNAGSIAIEAGRDPGITALVGGNFHLGATLLGYGGVKKVTVPYSYGNSTVQGAPVSLWEGGSGGSLSILANLIQIGGANTGDAKTLYLASDFFNQGGFSSFTLSGLGREVIDPNTGQPKVDAHGEYVNTPAVKIAAGTTIAPEVSNRVAVLGPSGSVVWTTVELEDTLRAPVSLAFKALGVKDPTKTFPVVARGDLVMEKGASINAGYAGSVTLNGQTVAVDGSIYAHGGTINLSGATDSTSIYLNKSNALATVVIGSDAILDASGAVVLVDDGRGDVTGAVLNGGSINVSGNIVAAAGAVMDVSGASGMLEIPGSYVGVASDGKVNRNQTHAAVVDSDGGTITLSGGQELYSDATLRGTAGGSTAEGGSLVVSSGYYDPASSSSNLPAALYPSLVITQSGSQIDESHYASDSLKVGMVITDADPVIDPNGNAMAGLGHFTVDTYAAGGFDSLSLKGTLLFRGDVALDAHKSLTVATGGVLYSTSSVTLNAGYIKIGSNVLHDPKTQAQYLADYAARNTNSQFYSPTYGTGVLTVSASLIDVGDVTLRDIGKANFIADNGDIRGSGTLDVAGDIYLRAGQIYPSTQTSFNVIAYDHDNVQGSVKIEGSGSRSTPLSAGGALNIYASKIVQGGVLRAPLGTINLGWNGVGSAPVDSVTGLSVDPISGQSFSSCETVTLLAGSITSVSANGLTIPYGIVSNDNKWIDPSGNDIASGGPTGKSVRISGADINSESGAVVDLASGGDLYAYQFVSGPGGSKDVLLGSNTANSYAIIPSYNAGYAANGAYNSSNTTYYSSDTGYTSSTLKVGETVYLKGFDGLPAGYYTLLPARYALLSGAYLVTVKSGVPTESPVKCTDGSYIVSGYLSNSYSSASDAGKTYLSFQVASSKVVRTRAAYTDYSANTYFPQQAKANGTTTPRLPGDAGQLVLSALTSLNWAGGISGAVSSGGRGAIVDISSSNDIVISDEAISVAAGTLLLNTSVLNSINADSLLIGGIRDSKENVTVTAESITLDGDGTALKGRDIILAATDSVTLAEGAKIEEAGTLVGSLATVTVNGNGSALRVSTSETAGVNRTGVNASSHGSLTISDGASISAHGLVMDSASAISLDNGAILKTEAISVHSGQISIEFDGQGLGDLKTTNGAVTTGLVLSGDALKSLMTSATKLELVSYSSIDIYGSGQIGNSDYVSLSFQAAELRGFNQGDVTFTAQNILLNNASNVSAPHAVDGQSSSLAGSLSFVGNVIQLGANQLDVSLYETLNLNASKAIVATGKGDLFTQGDLNMATPVLTGESAANTTVKAVGALNVLSNNGTADTSLAGLGSTVLLEGATVAVESRIELPSGNLTLHATQGDVIVSGALNANGVAKGFFGSNAYTDGGSVTLKADNGNVAITSSGSVNVSAPSGGGDAGTLEVDAIKGTFSAAGSLFASGGSGGDGGSFTLDVGSLSNTGWIDGLLNNASFNASRKYRVRTGDVAVDGYAKTANYRLSADQGSISVTDEVDASGEVGGSIYMAAHGSLVVKSGALLTVAAQNFNSAGAGGSITLEAGDSTVDSSGNYTYDPSALLDIQSGSKIDLSVASANSNSAALGYFTGKLHLRAPQDGTSTDLQMAPIDGEIVGASVIIVEGYKTYKPVGGSIDSVEAAVMANGNTFAGSTSDITDRLLEHNDGLRSTVSVRPGAEIVNTNTSTASLLYTLSGVGSSIAVPTETKVTFPTGTGSSYIITTAQAVITYGDGRTETLAAYTQKLLPANASITFSNSVGSGSIQFKSGSAAVSMLLPSSSTNVFTASAGTGSVTPTTSGYTVQLGKTSSKIAVAAGAPMTFTNGTPGNDKITASVNGTITLPDGTKKTLTKNVATAITPGSVVTLSAAGNISYTSGNGGAISVALSANNTYTLTGTVYVSSSPNDLTLGNVASTTTSDWNLATYRFGDNLVPGVLTLRSAGNVVLYNSISDGFESSANTSLLSAANSALPANAQSWSYRIAAGADLSGVDIADVRNLSDIDGNSGSLLLGKYGSLTTSGGAAASTSAAVNGYYQVVRTGSGDIEIYAGRNIKLRNQFAAIYTAGTLISDPSTIWNAGDFDVPVQDMNVVDTGWLGSVQQDVAYLAQYNAGGGNVTLVAGGDISHETLTKGGSVVLDSEYQLPVNWLYRRGYVDPSTGAFGTSYYGEVASTTWWVDFSNFFEGVGALGGGNVTMIAGNNITNVDAAIPTNARMPKGTPDASKLLELGGGQLLVSAGNDISGGVYYVERGDGTLYAADSILTNAARSPDYNVVTSYASSIRSVSSDSWLPTTLFLGKGHFDVSAGADLLLGPVVNAFLMPEGYSNTYWYKSYFSTYGSNSSVSVSSLVGDVTMREGATETTTSSYSAATSTTNILWLYLNNVLRYSSDTLTTSFYQPWLRLDESDVTAFTTASSLMPGTLTVTSFSGDINLIGALNLAPSPVGSLTLLSAGSLNGLNITGKTIVNDQTVNSWGTAVINLSDAAPSAIPGAASPFAYQELMGTSSDAGISGAAFLTSALDIYFNESGSVEGSAASLSYRQALHDPNILHVNDNVPVYIYANKGNISGLTLYSSKSAQIMAGNDISDIAFYIQNVRKGDVSLIYAGNDIVPYNSASTIRNYVTANFTSNQFTNADSYSLPGDIQISGPGTLEITAGRNIDLGNVYADATAPSDIGVGITSIGNARNPYLPYEGADMMVAAGLNQQAINYGSFIAQFLNPSTSNGKSAIYLSEIADFLAQELPLGDWSNATDEKIWSAFESLSKSQQQEIARDLFYSILRSAGRNHNTPSSPDYGYKSAYEAIAALFPGNAWNGSLSLTHREIKTTHGVSASAVNGNAAYQGGNISILVPGGDVKTGYNDTTVDVANQGIITEHGGQISIFSRGSVEVGTSRIFTLRGGDIIIWSTVGDIAAGSSSRTVKAASPTRVIIDPQSANVETDLSGLATGGGIGVLATVAGVNPGSVDLIAPTGTVDAGEAGIRVTGNLYVAALQVLNAGNIQVGGQSVGTTVAASGPSIGTLTSAANTSAAVMNSSATLSDQAANNSANMSMQEAPSMITVEVLGYGGGDVED